MGSWVNFLLTGDAISEVEGEATLDLTGDVTIVGSGKSLELVNLKMESPTELTISGGAITRTQVHHRVDTEGDAGSDELDTIAGGADGMILIIRPEDTAHTVNVRHNQSPAGANNILLSNGSNYSMDDDSDVLMLYYDALLDTNGAWVEIARGAGGVATLSNNTPEAVDGTAGSAGVGGAGSRDDHVHALGPLVADLDFDQNEAKSLILENSTGPDPAAEVEGQIYYDTGSNRPKVWVI